MYFWCWWRCLGLFSLNISWCCLQEIVAFPVSWPSFITHSFTSKLSQIIAGIKEVMWSLALLWYPSSLLPFLSKHLRPDCFWEIMVFGMIIDWICSYKLPQCTALCYCSEIVDTDKNVSTVKKLLMLQTIFGNKKQNFIKCFSAEDGTCSSTRGLRKRVDLFASLKKLLGSHLEDGSVQLGLYFSLPPLKSLYWALSFIIICW